MNSLMKKVVAQAYEKNWVKSGDYVVFLEGNTDNTTG